MAKIQKWILISEYYQSSAIGTSPLVAGIWQQSFEIDRRPFINNRHLDGTVRH
jgi:hypothetical protein